MGRNLKNLLSKKSFYIDEKGNIWQEGDVFQAISYKGFILPYSYIIKGLYSVKQKDNTYKFRVAVSELDKKEVSYYDIDFLDKHFNSSNTKKINIVI